MLHEQQQNGHAAPLAEDDLLEPLEWKPPRRETWLRRGWRLVSGRPVRAADSAESGRNNSAAVVLRWMGAIMFVLVQTSAITWWASRQTTIVEGHTEQLKAVQGVKDENIKLRADADHAKEDLARLTSKYNRLLEYEGTVLLYEAKIRELLASSGVRRSEFPDPPKLPQD